MNGILLDETGDIMIRNGSMAIGNNDMQSIALIIESQKGEFKEYPTLGFGIDNYLKSPDTTKRQFICNLERELQSSGYKNAKVKCTGDNILEFEVFIN
jgi:hypothetical protein